MPTPVTINTVGQTVMRYWPAILAVIFLVSSATIGQYQLVLHGKAIEKINAKLETDTNETAQWDVIMGSGQDIVSLDTRLKEVEQHITPPAIQAWGRIQATVLEDHEDLKNHLRGHQ